MKINMIRKGCFIVALLAFGFQSNAQEWEVPSNESEVKCPTTFTPKTAQEGKDLFNAKCKSCHGGIGTNASLPLVPPPGDPAEERFASQTDGDLFYKMTYGRGGMPGFQSQLGENERWAIISYIRTFHPNYKPEGVADNAEPVVDNSFKGKDITLEAIFSYEAHEAIVKVKGQLNGEEVKAQGVRVGFFVKRNFGFLQIGKAITSDANGLAVAQFPTDLPGDSIGNYQIKVKLIDDDVYGNIELVETVAFGKPFIYDNPLNYRSLQGDGSSVPLWLLFSYIGMVVLAWSIIFWVVFQMLKLKKQA